MSTAPATTDATQARVVLFGPAAAGKSALLTAFGQVRQNNPELLPGDPAGMPETTELDGELAQRRPQEPEPPLVPELERSDALLLPLDLSRSEDDRAQDLADLARFLRRFELDRSRRCEVGGLPVFVVLTKADSLAAPGDGIVEWMEKLEAAKRQVRQRLVTLLQAGHPPRPTAFGRLDLSVWATSAWSPALAGSPVRPEPHGVAELFRQVLAQAVAHRERRGQSRRVLLGTSAAAAGLLVVMALMALTLVGGVGEKPPSELEIRVRAWQEKQGSQSLALRLRGLPTTLERRLQQLQEFERDEGFGQLPAPLQELVVSRRAELQRYLSYLMGSVDEPGLLRTRPPTLARNDGELDAAEKELRGRLALPHPTWIDTDAGKLHEQRLADILRIRTQTRIAEEWYRQQRKRALELWTFAEPPRQGDLLNWRDWNTRVTKLLSEPNVPPPGVLVLPANTLVTQQTILNQDRVARARDEALNGRQMLQAQRNIAAALGIVDAGPDLPPLLVLPAPPEFKATDAGPLLEKLRIPYPEYEIEFVVRNVSEAARPAVSQAARTSLNYLLPAGQEVIRQRFLRATADTPAQRWEAMAEWLAGNPEELKAWRRLALLLGGLLEAMPVDHAAELQQFLTQKEFPLTLERLTVEVADDAPVRIPEGTVLMVTHRQQNHRFALPADGKVRDAQNRITRYTFEAERLKLAYKPGDVLSAQIALRENDLLTWDQPRAATFAFDALSQPPRLHRKGQQGIALRDVTLRVRPGDGIPGVPALLPTVP